LSFIPNCLVLLFGTLLTANGSLRYLNWIAGVGLLLNISLNFILIPQFGATGAAITTLITQSLVAVVQIIIVKNQIGLQFNWKKSLVYPVFCIVLYGASMLMPSGMQGIQVLLIFSVVAGITFLALGNIK